MDIQQAFKILEIDPKSSLEQIKQAYKDLVFIWHPDRFPIENSRLIKKAEEKFKDINEAYDIIKLEYKKKQETKFANRKKSNSNTEPCYQKKYYKDNEKTKTKEHIYLDILLGKKRWYVSSRVVSYNNIIIRTEDINRIRWGFKTRLGFTRMLNSALGLDNWFRIKRRYIFIIGSDFNNLHIECDNFLKGYDFIVNQLWVAIGKRIFVDMITKLSTGYSLDFGKISVNNTGVLFKHWERYCHWKDLTIESKIGQHFIIKSKEFDCYEKLSYLDIDNINILEVCIRLLLEKTNYSNGQQDCGNFSKNEQPFYSL